MCRNEGRSPQEAYTFNISPGGAVASSASAASGASTTATQSAASPQCGTHTCASSGAGMARSGAPLGIEEVDEEEVFDEGDPDEDEARALSYEAFEVLFINFIYEQYY